MAVPGTVPSTQQQPCNGSLVDCTCLAAIVLDPVCVARYGTATAFSWLTSAAQAQLRQEYQQCVANVQQAQQAVLSKIQNDIAGASSIADIMSVAVTTGTTAVAADAAATAAVVTGVATTLPEVAAAAAAGAIIGYVGAKVSGIRGDILLSAFEKILNFAATKIMSRVASKQTAQCAKDYPTGQ